MPSWGTARARTLSLGAGICCVLALVLAPASAQAARAPAKVTVTACDADHMTVIGALKLTGKAARQARGAQLQMQFEALPIFGFPQLGPWRTLGAKTKGSGQQVFTGLAADSWLGVMNWRFKKGSKTVASGLARSQPGRLGGAAGGAFCTLSEGLKPIDKTPPAIYVLPLDDVWHHGPTQVYVVAQDDFSGVQSVSYTLDGGPQTFIQNGSTFTIDSEGAHALHLSATDVAGNTATRDVVVRVDESAPTKPQLTLPYSVTSKNAPNFGTFSWTASTDSGSGIKGYILQIKRASDGSAVAFIPTDAQTTSANAAGSLDEGQTYTASVVAVDKTDQPFSTESDPITFRVDSNPRVTSSSPANKAIASGAGKDANLTLTLDRPADPSTVAASTVQLALNSESGGTPNYAVTCDASCTTITVDPQGTLPEGLYTLTLNGVKSQEGIAIPGSIAFAVAFREDPGDSDNSMTTGVCTGSYVMSPLDATPAAKSITLNAAETITVHFDYSVTGSGKGKLEVMDGASAVAASAELTGSGTGASADVNLSAGTHTLSVRYDAICSAGGSSTTFTARNIVQSRVVP